MKKNSFKSGIGFILAAAGSAIGLGNLWAFPYKTASNGGAAFVFVYILCVIVIGFFTMMCEVYIGRRSHANAVSAYRNIHRNLGWCGLVAVALPAFITCYYSVLGGWVLKFAAHSFQGNTGILETFSVNTGEVIFYTFLFILISILIIIGGVEKGIEKMSKVLMPILFLIIIGIAGYSLTLGSGVKEGLMFYLKPDFSALTFRNILIAMGQSFYSLSLGMGIMITYGSYAGEEINLTKSCLMICLFDTLIALLAGLAIFPAVAHFDPSLLGSSKGIALIFVILPEVFDSLGFIGHVVSFFFFLMVAIAAITSVVSLIEVVTQFIIQVIKTSRKKAALAIALFCFLLSIPISISLGHVAIKGEAGPAIFHLDYLTFMDEMTNTVLMPVCALFACYAIGWIVKPKNMLEDLNEEGKKLPFLVEKGFILMVRFVTPLLILIVEIGGIRSEIISGQLSVIAASVILILLCILVYFLFIRNAEIGTNANERNLK